MRKTFKFRLRPTKKQVTILSAHVEECRLLYNQLVCARAQAWRKNQKSLSLYDQHKTLPLMKKQHPAFTQVYSQVLQQVAVRVDLAFKAFFRRVRNGEKPGFPRYKNETRYGSITYPQFKNGYRISNKGLHLGKVGCIRMTQHREIEGTPKTCTISKTATGKWFVAISCDIEDKPTEIRQDLPGTGLDVGLEKFATLSNGETIPNPKFFRTEEKNLAKVQRKWDSVKTSKRTNPVREKRRKVVARVHERIRNKRHDFTHQTARRLVNRFSLIAHEDLSINWMVRNKKFSKSISDAAWSLFLQVLAYKAEEAGCAIVPVNPAYTSQDCSACGHRKKKLLSDRWHTCESCGLELDRDHNAAINILRLGRQSQAA